LIGAGSAQFGFGTLGDIFQSQVLKGSEIVLHDINPQSLSRVEKVAQQYIQQHELPFTLSATTTRAEALQGANFCVISIEVGNRFDLWELDWHIPLQYGIRQVFGENGGPGGLFHALRIIPPILEICGDVMSLCPEAYVFNFSNPMSRICTTVHAKYPDVRLVGLCHEINSLPRHLPQILDTPFSNLSIVAGGLNHFSVLLKAHYKDSGKDAYPDIREKAPAYFQNLPSLPQVIQRMKEAQAGPAPDSERTVRDGTAAQESASTERHRTWSERGLFKEILSRFGYLPITTDSHFGEYVQWAHDVVDHEGILDFYRFYKQLMMTQKPALREGPASERVVPMIEGILANTHQEELALNLPNEGLIANLPSFLAVEVPGTVDKNGAHGTVLGELPKGFAGLLHNQVAVHDLTAEAVLTGSRQVALQALLVDPVVHSLKAAEQTLDTILELQQPYLDYLK
jgi:alpha-galactosidase